MNKDLFLDILDENRIKFDEPLSNHTTFRVGGPANIFVTVCDACELSKTIKASKEAGIPYYLLGKGSNVLVGDKGFRGVIITLGGEMSDIKVTEETMNVGAGVSLADAARYAMKNSLTGLEFAGGIPGSIGGALYMNAGAYGGEMSQVVESVDALDSDGNIVRIDGKDMKFGYRHSILKEKEMTALGCVIRLQRGNEREIQEKMQELAFKRKEKQPLEYPSAGSTFKRPEGYFAGKLIEDSGLGGYTVGGAEVSMKHKGFVINKNNATAKDIKQLIEDVQRIVLEKQGVKLEPEVIMLGEF